MAIFEVYAGDTLIHHSQSPSPDVKLLNPKLKLEISAAGSFTCKVPPSNIGYDLIDRLTTEITVKKDGLWLWSGRVISEEMDFWNNRTITCEGELAYLNDTTQPPAEYHNKTVRGFLETLIEIHNNKVSSNKRFTVGIVTVTDPNDSLYRYTNFESTLEDIKDKMIDRLGGYIRVRKENGVRYIDYLAEPMNTNSQTIQFGKNLLDFSKSWDLSDFATVVLPQGERLDESPIEALDAYLDVSSVNGGSIYVYDQATVDTYGWIEVLVSWSDVSQPSNLLSKAKKYLSDIQFDNMELEVSAVDLSYMMNGASTEMIKLFDKIHCVSPPHGMDRYFPVTKIEIPIDNPENTTFTLGNTTVRTSLSASIKSGNQEIIDKINSIPSTTSTMDKIIKEADDNAKAIMNQVTNGYITIETKETVDGIHSEALYIRDAITEEDSTRYWKWTVNGLAYYKDKEEIGIALTMNGQIKADFITTGILNANVIRAGIIEDANGYNYWNLGTGEFRMAAAHASLDGNSIATQTYASNAANNASNSAYNNAVKDASTNTTNKIAEYNNSLTQTAIFNKLTNNGAAQGMYMTSDGQLYINAEYIQTGIIKDKNNNITWNLNTGTMVASTLAIETDTLRINSSSTRGVIVSRTNKDKTQYANWSTVVSSGNIGFWHIKKNSSEEVRRGSIEATGDGLSIYGKPNLVLSADNISINGTSCNTTNSCYVRASNGQVMHLGFISGLFTGYSLSGDYGVSADMYVRMESGSVAHLNFNEGILVYFEDNV